MINNVELRDKVTTALIDDNVDIPNNFDLSSALRKVGAGDTIWFEESGQFVRCQFCGYRAQRESIGITTKHELDELAKIYMCVKSRRKRQKGI